MPTGLTAMRRRRCTGQNSVSKHPTGSPAHGCTYKKSPNLKSIVGIRYGEPDSVMLHLISLQFLGAPLRQKSSLQMNRKLTWEQNPGSCFEKQLTPSSAPPADADGNRPTCAPKRLNMNSGHAGKIIPAKTGQSKNTSGESC